MFETLPSDPMLCLSVVNTKLRDHYKDLDALCKDLSIEKAVLIEKFHCIDYEYDENVNQFI